MSATEEDGGEAQDEEMPDAQQPVAPKEEEQEQSMIREAAIGKGILLPPSGIALQSSVIQL